MRSTDVLILGGGIAGLSTAWHLAAEAGPRILLAERDPLLASRSSALNAAVLRTHDPDPAVREALLRGARFLRRPPAGFAEVPLVDPVGLAIVADAAGAPTLRRMAREALPFADAGAAGDAPGGEPAPEWLEGERLRRRLPFLGPQIVCALLFPEEGRIDIAALTDGFARGARARGAELLTRCEAVELLREGDAVRGARLADGTRVEARTTVLAAGGWAGRLGRAAGSRVALQPRRRHLVATAPDPGTDPSGSGHPVVWRVGGPEQEFYCRPESGGWLLCACDDEPVDPDAAELVGEVRALAFDKAGRTLAREPRSAGSKLWFGLRTFAPDARFTIGPDPDLAGLFWVAGLGGHGMGAGPEVGRLAAARLRGDPPEPLAAAFDPARPAARARPGSAAAR